MEAINNFGESIKRQNVTLSKLSQTYSDCAKKSLPASEPRVIFREVLRETKNEELIQERERESRAKNIIIHGFPETDYTDIEKEKEDNTKLVNGLLDTLQLEETYVKITRLCQRKDDKTLLLKISMTTLNEKQLIMSNLRKLKNVSVKHH